MSSFAETPFDGRMPDKDIEPELSEVVAQFDDADLAVRMAYSRFFDKPNPAHMQAINDSSGDLYDAFGEVLRKVKSDTKGVIDIESRPGVIAGLIHTMNVDHSLLIAEYSSAIVLPTNQQSEQAFKKLKSLFEEDNDEIDMSDLVDAALGEFSEVLRTDMELIEHFAIEKASSPKERMKQLAIEETIKVAKIGAGVVLGLFVYDKFRKN